MDKMTIYEQCRGVPKDAQKPIAAGRLKGKTDINPMWRIKKLTEIFGPAGIGWKFDPPVFEEKQGAKGEVMVHCFTASPACIFGRTLSRRGAPPFRALVVLCLSRWNGTAYVRMTTPIKRPTRTLRAWPVRLWASVQMCTGTPIKPNMIPFPLLLRQFVPAVGRRSPALHIMAAKLVQSRQASAAKRNTGASFA